MPKRQQAHHEAWTLDQLAKSTFFHRKLHEWKLLETASQIDQVHGENLDWHDLNISEQAWRKVIHRGIKPVIVFAHPYVLQSIPGSASYYRMLALVSQKSMKRVGLNLDPYEAGKPVADDQIAVAIARHLNRIVSALVEADEEIDAREFDLWRGMAAGSQAQGSWQNTKGASAEKAIREVILQRLQKRQLISGSQINATRIDLRDGRVLVFADEPDIAIVQNDVAQIAVEIKGGIDQAGVLERIGAALKSLRRTRQENPDSVTVLILPDVAMTERALDDLSINVETVTHLCSLKEILEDEHGREGFFQILQL